MLNRKMSFINMFRNLCLAFVSLSVISSYAYAGDLDNSKLYQKIKKQGYITAGVSDNAPGNGYLDPTTNEYRGYEIEISKIIADKLGVPVKFVTITPINRLPYLEDGTIDMLIANFTITEERKKVLDMTVPYYTDHVSVLVEKKSGIKSLEDLLGTQIAVIRNTSSPLALVQELINQELIKKPDGFSETNFDPAKWTEGVTFKIYDDFKAVNKDLSRKKIAGFCIDKSVLQIYKNIRRTYIKDEFSPQPYGIAFKKDSGLVDFVDGIIEELKQDGTLKKLCAENEISYTE
ncbi:MAG: transporter substrate-binding domain-containing protein [Succinivibrio sp.]|nr:transporter substrate-binding domain-containing protein [Succinivibrio sp.]